MSAVTQALQSVIPSHQPPGVMMYGIITNTAWHRSAQERDITNLRTYEKSSFQKILDLPVCSGTLNILEGQKCDDNNAIANNSEESDEVFKNKQEAWCMCMVRHAVL